MFYVLWKHQNKQQRQLIRRYPSPNPETFNGVKVFAEDDFDPASNAGYKNREKEKLSVPDILFNLHIPVKKTNVFSVKFSLKYET